MVIGENEKFASAIIVPSFEKFETYFKDNGISIPQKREEFIAHPVFQKIMTKEVDHVNKTLADHEQIKRFRIVPDEWKVGEELSQTMKLKRKVIYEKYDDLCRKIYNYDNKEQQN